MKSYLHYITKLLIESESETIKTVKLDDIDVINWFTGSKIVDTEGNPLLLYHGSVNGNIKQIKPSFDGAWFTDNIKVSQAYSRNYFDKPTKKDKIYKFLEDNYHKPIGREEVLKLIEFGFGFESGPGADKYGFHDGTKRYTFTTPDGLYTHTISNYSRCGVLLDYFYPSGKNYRVILNIKNPLIVDAENRSWDHLTFQNKTTNTMNVAKWAKTNGYDGVVFTNLYERYILSNVFVAFNKNQIKHVK